MVTAFINSTNELVKKFDKTLESCLDFFVDSFAANIHDFGI